MPKEQLKKLEEWRSFVVVEDFYNELQLGPGRLLLTYDLQLWLMEASYILLLKYKDSNSVSKRVSTEQLKAEVMNWLYFTADFPDDELANPYIALDRCFIEYPTQAYRDNLHAWLHVALSNHTDFETLVPGEIINFWENMRRVCNAAWLIRQREDIHHAD
ncbi:hypothetical protein [Mucilaginibacter sp.]|uniref:hypothetical protein n=1 Tax=Mucilaginibacter sp. TaxID=1882438 RepID=UPI003D09C68F